MSWRCAVCVERGAGSASSRAASVVKGEISSAQHTSDLNTLPIPARRVRQQHARELGCRIEHGEARDNCVEIDAGRAEIRARGDRSFATRVTDVRAPSASRRSSTIGAAKQHCARAVFDTQDDARGVPGAAPALTRHVYVPGAGHLHVRMQHLPIGEVDEQVFARGVDRGDRRAGLGRASPTTGRAGIRTRPGFSRRALRGVAPPHERSCRLRARPHGA